MKTICVDARMWGVKNTGIGRYIENLIDHLPKNIVLIIAPEAVNEPKLAKHKKFVAKFHPYSNLAQFEMLWLLWKIKPDLIHVPHFTIPVLWPGKLVITIHDLIKHISRGPETTTRHPIIYWIKYLQYLLIVWISVKRATRIIVPAEFWKKMLVANYGSIENKIDVTYEGVSDIFFKGKINRNSEKYLLYVGNVYPHKNIPLLLKAIKKMPGENLIVACARSVFSHRLHQLVEKLDMQSQVEFRHLLDDEKLAGLYKNAQAFITPSLIEGFGLPGLEAMAAGTPVIAANTSCLPEIYGDAALFFDPTDSEDLVEKVSKVLTNSKFRNELIKKGHDRVRLFSWEKMAQNTWQIYQSVLH